MREPLLELRGVCRHFQAGGLVQALNDVDLSIYAGEFLLILGPSGSGKSTLLSVIGGLDRPTAGEIMLEKQAIHRLSENQLAHLRRRKMGFMFQFFNLLSTLSALDNVALPLRMNGVSTHEARERAKQLLDLVGLSARLQHVPDELSGGEQQRVALARALATSPALLLADEPTGNLDSGNSSMVMELLERFNREQEQTIVVVSHDHAFRSIAHRVVHMRDGYIAEVEDLK
ncbi:MAG: ABC transporter ATP-binding protein [Firmicutes bacterium]|nr:ABC transporter ATP-binding protein [Bacillota bacterium]